MAEKKETVAKTENKEKMVRIFIPRTRELEGNMFVSVNARTFSVPVGIEVEVPDFVAEVIRNSQMAEEEIYQKTKSI